MANKKCEGYLLRLSEYKDNDRIVNVLSKEGIICFHAYGVRKIGSKNASSLLPLSYSSFLLSEKNGLYSLKEGTLLKAPPYKDDLKSMAALSFIDEIASKLIMEEEAKEAYPWLDASLSSIEEGFSLLSSALILFAHLIEIEGYGLNVDECVHCGSKKGIVGISYEEGGFICKDEVKSPSTIYPKKRYLEIMRYIFRCPLSSFSRVSFVDTECIEIIESLCGYLKNACSISFKSLTAIKASI